MKESAALAVVILLSVLLAVYIYLNPVSSSSVGPNTVTTDSQTNTSFEVFRNNLSVSLTHSVSSGMHRYEGALPVPAGCMLSSGAAVYAGNPSRIVVDLQMTKMNNPEQPCDSGNNPRIESFEVAAGAGGGGAILSGVVLNSFGIKYTIDNQ